MRNKPTNGDEVADRLTIRTSIILGIAISLMISFKINSLLIGLLVINTLWKESWTDMKRRLLEKGKLILPYLSFFLLYLISLIYTDHIGLGWKDLESKLALLILPLCIFAQPKLGKRELHFIMLGFALFTLLFGIACLLVSLISTGGLATNQQLSGMLGVHASYLSLYSILGLATLVFFAQKKHFGSRSKWLYVLSLIQFILLMLLAARIIILSFMVIGLLWLIFFNYSRRKLLSFLGLIVIVAAIGMSVEGVRTRFLEAVNFEDRVELDTDPEEHRTLNRDFGGRAIRMAIWECSMDVVESHWLIGVGAGDVHEHLQQSYKDHAFEFAWKYNNYNAHNIFIETIIGVGIIGIGILIYLFALLFRLAFRTENLILLTFSVSFFMLSLMESSFNVQKGLIFFLIFSLSFLNARHSAFDN